MTVTSQNFDYFQYTLNKDLMRVPDPMIYKRVPDEVYSQLE